MTWTYSADPSTSEKDQVRFLVGDTDSTEQFLQDEEIDWLVVEEGTAGRAAVRAARTIAARFSRLADERKGDQARSYSQRAKAYLALAEKLEQETAVVAAGAPWAGGIRVGQKESAEEDTDRVAPRFSRKLFRRNT